MAAHIVTGLEQAIDGLKKGKTVGQLHLKTALELSCWTEDLDTGHWQVLDRYVSKGNDSAVLGACEAMLPGYREEYFRLGYPATREEWRERKWKSDLLTSQ